MHRACRLSVGATGLALALVIPLAGLAAAAEAPAACLAENFPTNQLRCFFERVHEDEERHFSFFVPWRAQ